VKLALALPLFACAETGGPRLSSVTPEQAPAGANVVLQGMRFCGEHVACAGVTANVVLGLSPPILQAVIVSYSDMAATIQIPTVAEARATDLVLTVDGHSSNALSFEVLP